MKRLQMTKMVKDWRPLSDKHILRIPEGQKAGLKGRQLQFGAKRAPRLQARNKMKN